MAFHFFVRRSFISPSLSLFNFDYTQLLGIRGTDINIVTVINLGMIFGTVANRDLSR